MTAGPYLHQLLDLWVGGEHVLEGIRVGQHALHQRTLHQLRGRRGRDRGWRMKEGVRDGRAVMEWWSPVS